MGWMDGTFAQTVAGMPFYILSSMVKTQKEYAYDKVSANTASSVPKTSKFQSGHRVVNLVLNT